MLQDSYFQHGGHLSEPMLRQFVNGNLASDVLVQVEAHMAVCSQCQSSLDHIIEDVGAARPALMALTQAFARSGVSSPVPELAPTSQPFPDFESIAAYVDGLLDAEQTREFEMRMRQMPQLAQEVAELRALQERLRTTLPLERADTGAKVPPGALPARFVKARGVVLPVPKVGGARWGWPLQSLGMATALSLLLFLVVTRPWQQLSYRHQPMPSQQPPQKKPGTSTPTSAPASGTAPNGTIPNGTIPNGTIPNGTIPEQHQTDDDVVRGDVSDADVQQRLLGISNPRRESQSLLRLVEIQPYKGRGRFDSQGIWHSAHAADAFKPLALSQRLDFKVGDGVRFVFKNQSSQTLYLTQLWLAQDGSIAPMIGPPPTNSPVIRLTPRGTSGAQVSTANYGIRPPAAVENIKLFLSTRPINPAYLQFDGPRNIAPSKAVTLSPVDTVLKQALITQQAANSPVGSASSPADLSTWATINFKIRIRQN